MTQRANPRAQVCSQLLTVTHSNMCACRPRVTRSMTPVMRSVTGSHRRAPPTPTRGRGEEVGGRASPRQIFPFLSHLTVAFRLKMTVLHR
jgi:hypothetical protein